MYKIKTLFHNKTIRNGGIFAFFSFLNQGLNFLLLLVISWYILPESYGKLNLFYTSITIIAAFISLNTNGIVGIKFFKVPKHELSEYISVIIFTVVLMVALLLTLIFCFHDNIQFFSGIEYNLQLVCIYICGLSVFYNIFTDIYRLEEKPLKYGVVTTLYTILNIVGTFFFIIALKQDWLGRIYANLITITFLFIVAIYFLIKKRYISKKCLSFDKALESWRFGLPLIPHYLTSWLRQGVDRFIINAHFVTSYVGFFSFAMNFANIISIAGTAFNQSNSVYIFKCLSEDPEGNRRKIRQQTFYMLIMFLILTFFVISFCYLFIPFLFPRYNDAVIYIIPLCCAAFFQCVYLLFCNILFFYKKTTQLMYITFSISLVHLLLSLLLTYKSVMYTSYISLLSSFLQAIIVFFYSRKLYKLF